MGDESNTADWASFNSLVRFGLSMPTKRGYTWGVSGPEGLRTRSVLRPAARPGGGWRRLLYYGYILARIVSAILPITVSYWIAERVADLWFVFSPTARANLKHNLRLVPGTPRSEAGIRRMSNRIMRNFARVVTEFLYLRKRNLENIGDLVDVASFIRLRQLLGEETAILVTAHVGNWELGAAMASMLGIDLYVVVYDHPDRRVAELFRRRREAKGLKVMSVKEAAKIIPAVLGSSCVGIVGDRDFTKQGMEAAFFGVPVTVPYAYASLACARRIRVIPGFCIRQEDGIYHLVPEMPEALETDGEDGARQIVEKCLTIFEKCVEKYPEQWYFFERVGRERASG